MAAAHTWTPDADTWALVKKRSVERSAAIAITGAAGTPARPASRGRGDEPLPQRLHQQVRRLTHLHEGIDEDLVEEVHQLAPGSARSPRAVTLP